MGDTQAWTGADDGWPWSCTRCGTKVYHYGSVCRECDRTERVTVTADAGGSTRVVRSLPGWMRRQSYTRFVVMVLVVAGVGLAVAVLLLAVLSPVAPVVPALP